MMRYTFTAVLVVFFALGALLGCGPLVFPNNGNPTDGDNQHHRH
jgi:integrase